MHRPGSGIPQGYNPDHTREVALYQTWLAEGYARTGNHDAARHVLDHIDTSAVDAGSVRLQRRIDAVNRLITTGSPRPTSGPDLE